MDRHETLLSRIIQYATMFLLVLTPLAFGSVHVWAYTIMVTASALMLAAWTVRAAVFPTIEPLRRVVPLYICFFLILLVAFIQTVHLPAWAIKALSPKAHELFTLAIQGYASGEITRCMSTVPVDTKAEAAKLFSYFAVFFLVTTSLREKGSMKKLAAVIIIAGFFEALLGLYWHFSGSNFIFGYERQSAVDSVAGTFVNRNHFAGYLGIPFFTALGYILGMLKTGSAERRGLRHRIADLANTPDATVLVLLMIATVTIALGIVFSLSRMGVFSLVVSLLAMVSMLALGRNLRYLSVTVLIALLALFAANLYGMRPLGALLERYSTAYESFTQSRAVVWRATADMAEDFPVLGTGLGTYQAAFQRYKPLEMKERLRQFTHAHNEYLETVSDMGTVGALPFLLGAVYLPVVLFRGMDRRKGGFKRGIHIGGIGALVYVYVFSLTDFNMRIPSNAFAFSVLMALACNCSGGERSVRAREVSGRKGVVKFAGFFIVLLLCVQSGVFCVRQWLAESAFPVQRNFTRESIHTRTPGEEQAGRIMSAISYMPYEGAYYALMGKHHAFSWPKDTVLSKKQRAERLKKAGEEFSRALYLNPFYSEALSYLARVRFMQGRPLEGIELFEAAIGMDPNNYFNHTYFGITLVDFMDELPEGLAKAYKYRAESELENGMEINREMAWQPSASMALAGLYASRGDLQSAIRALAIVRGERKATLPHFLFMANLYFKAGNPLFAVRTYQALIENSENDEDDMADIISAMQSAARDFPGDDRLYTMIGRACLKAGLWEQVEEALKKISSPVAETHYLLGLAYEGMGEKAAARGEYIEAMEISPDHEGASRRLLLLNREGFN